MACENFLTGLSVSWDVNILTVSFVAPAVYPRTLLFHFYRQCAADNITTNHKHYILIERVVPAAL